jgi:hypothetical protein
VGTLFNPGDIIATGPKSRVEITAPDGAIMRVGQNSKLQCDRQDSFTPNSPSFGDTVKLLLGKTWATIDDALGGDHSFEVQSERACAGVRGSAYTASIQPDGKLLFHVIHGTGYVEINEKKVFFFPAGEGVLLNPANGHYTETSEWPAADQALVPANQTPPKLTNVRLIGSGRRTTLRFKLNQNAAVTVQVQRGKRRVLSRTASARKGAGSIKLGALRRGRYALTVFATAQKRTTAAQESFRVR